MRAIVYKGKHSELCSAISNRRKDEALELIYAFFRSEDNTDSYSISVLTVVRELLESGDSDELYRMRIRMRSSGDRVLINFAQLVHAFAMGGFDDAAETLAGKCLSDMPKLSRSMQDYSDEEGLSPATEMAGKRIHEAVRILRMYFDSVEDEKAIDKLDDLNLEMSRVFLFTEPGIMSGDMKLAALSAQRQNDLVKRDRLCREIVRDYGDVVERLTGNVDFSREDYEIAEGVKYAYETLHDSEPDHPYEDKVAALSRLFSTDKD